MTQTLLTEHKKSISKGRINRHVRFGGGPEGSRKWRHDCGRGGSGVSYGVGEWSTRGGTTGPSRLIRFLSCAINYWMAGKVHLVPLEWGRLERADFFELKSLTAISKWTVSFASFNSLWTGACVAWIYILTCVKWLISIAGLRIRLGLGFLYYAEYFNWFGFRLWSLI